MKSIVDIAVEEFPVADLAPGTVIGSEYTVVEKIGEGLLGPVYVVTDEDGDEAALKILRSGVTDPRLTADRLEAAVERAAERDGFVVPDESGEHDGNLYIVMDRLQGRTLRQAIDDATEPLPLPWIEHVFTALIDRLVAARPETHGHLGPEHVMIVQEPTEDRLAEVHILGWERSWLLRKDLVGDDGLPPESAWRKAPEEDALGGRRPGSAQVWAVGVMLYEAVTGVPPAGSYELPSALRKDAPAAIDDVVEVALSFSAADRFQGSHALAVALEEAFADGSGSDRGPAGRSLLIVAGLGLLVLGLVFGFIALKPTEEDLREREQERRTALRNEMDPGRVQPPGAAPKPGMTYVPAGPYLAGRFSYYDDEAGPAERPETSIDVAAFWIDELPFVNPMLNDPYAPPLTTMSFTEAGLLCEKFGKRLCTEDEWEKACKGPKSLIFSYGDEWDPVACPKSGFFGDGYRLSDYPDCVSGYGAVGMTGGVGEWTSTEKGDGHVVKPAEVGSLPKHSRCAGRTDREDELKSQHIGMRCCLDPS